MIRKKILLYLLVFLCIEGGLFTLLFWGKQRAEQRYVESVLIHHQGEYDANLASFARLARFTAQEIFMRPEVVAIFAQAAKANGQERDRLRQAMYTRLLPSYDNLTQEYFRQVHYHFADGTSFLRMHLPERFADDLFASRPSVRIANTEKRQVEGFEVGRDYHAFRHIFPLQKEGNHLGTVEVSEPFFVISKALRQIYREEYFLILKESLLQESLTPQGLKNYVASSLVAGYLQENADLAGASGGYLDSDLIARINKPLRAKISGKLEAGKPFAQSVLLDGQDYLVIFLPVVEIGGQVAGFLVSYGGDLPLTSLRHGYLLAQLLVTLLLVLLFALHLRDTRKIDGQLGFQRQLLEGIPLPICLKDRAGIMLSCNQAFAEMSRLPREKIIGQLNASLIDPQVAEQQQALDKKVIDSGKKQQEEVHISYPDGSSRDLLVVKAPFVDEDGRVAGIIGSSVDITGQKKYAAELQQAHAELDQIFNTAANGMRVVDLSDRVIRANQTFCALVGLTEQEVVGRKCYETFSGPACQTERCPRARIMQGALRLEVEAVKYLPSGRKLDCLVTSTPYYGANGQLIGIIEDFKDITHYKELEQRLREIAITDELTGLFNRRGFLTLAEKQLGNGLRAEHDMFLIFADLDNMKEINDTLGHETGDLALATAAAILRTTFRQADILARLGGDEFAVFISCKPGTDSEQAIVSRLEANIAQENRDGKRPFPVAISFGVVRFNEGETLGQLMIRADVLMYDSKLRSKLSKNEERAKQG
ncbi:sensor domain-containing diguanylate cyclase [Thiovibrio frasassiensis]|uniref:Diguanylate cyclase n=1 Tax=Thiovibrio frasassiensis TaxID=2984131 RepID=A0A9X4MDC5_9BACT|nr:diguanylate cyclase [Thiovibrio frasassiensis]MDG4475276.1 diguanylate cyclase [Thiovibrio frasassiensis]